MTAAVARPLRSRARNRQPDDCRGLSESTRRIRVDGVEVRYLIAGSGPPLLVVASPLVFARAYLPVVRKLCSSFTVVVVEPPGAGASDRLDHAWTFERYGAWLIDFIHRLPLAAPIVVGHSNSAPIVIEAARRSPSDMRGIVLVGPCGACEPRSVARVLAARAIDAVGEPLFSVRATSHLVRAALRHKRVFFEHVRAAAAADFARQAKDVRLPTLLAWGDQDRTVPLDCASRLGAAIDGAKLVVGSGSHDWIITRADAFARVVRRFSAEIVNSARS